jgi:hypothetical protein
LLARGAFAGLDLSCLAIFKMKVAYPLGLAVIVNLKVFGLEPGDRSSALIRNDNVYLNQFGVELDYVISGLFIL